VNPVRLCPRARPPGAARCVQPGEHVAALSEQARRKRSRKFSTRATRRRRGRSCGCGRNIFSSPHRCRTSCTGICDRRRHPFSPRPRCDSAQRHASEHRRPRAMRLLIDLPRTAVGRSLADHRRDLVLHQPTRSCWKRSRAGRSAIRTHAAETSGDYLSHQRAAPAACAREKSRRPRHAGRGLADR